jgi:hypothetical protein
MSLWAWWADPIWWRLQSSSAELVWNVHTQLWPRSVVDQKLHIVAKPCKVMLNLSGFSPFCSYYGLRLRLLRKWPRCTQERRANWNSSKSLGTASILSCIQWRAESEINKFCCKEMLVKKAKSSYWLGLLLSRISDFSRFLYMLIPNFFFLQSLKSFLGEDKLKVSLCGVFTFFHWFHWSNIRLAKVLHMFLRNSLTSPFITLLTWISQLKGWWRTLLNNSVLH